MQKSILKLLFLFCSLLVSFSASAFNATLTCNAGSTLFLSGTYVAHINGCTTFSMLTSDSCLAHNANGCPTSSNKSKYSYASGVRSCPAHATLSGAVCTCTAPYSEFVSPNGVVSCELTACPVGFERVPPSTSCTPIVCPYPSTLNSDGVCTVPPCPVGFHRDGSNNCVADCPNLGGQATESTACSFWHEVIDSCVYSAQLIVRTCATVDSPHGNGTSPTSYCKNVGKLFAGKPDTTSLFHSDAPFHCDVKSSDNPLTVTLPPAGTGGTDNGASGSGTSTGSNPSSVGTSDTSGGTTTGGTTTGGTTTGGTTTTTTTNTDGTSTSTTTTNTTTTNTTTTGGTTTGGTTTGGQTSGGTSTGGTTTGGTTTGGTTTGGTTTGGTSTSSTTNSDGSTTTTTTTGGTTTGGTTTGGTTIGGTSTTGVDTSQGGGGSYANSGSGACGDLACEATLQQVQNNTGKTADNTNVIKQLLGGAGTNPYSATSGLGSALDGTVNSQIDGFLAGFNDIGLTSKFNTAFDSILPASPFEKIRNSAQSSCTFDFYLYGKKYTISSCDSLPYLHPALSFIMGFALVVYLFSLVFERPRG